MGFFTLLEWIRGKGIKMKALILCAGLGTRLGLKKTPKCMVKVNGKPILEHLVNHLNKHGITEIIVNVHKNYNKIFKYFGTRLLYLYEPTLLGEMGTINMVRGWLGTEFILMNGDTLTNVDITKMIDRAFSHQPAKFVKNGRYSGTMFFTDICEDALKAWDGDGAYYFDCGTPSKLQKARRFYAKLR